MDDYIKKIYDMMYSPIVSPYNLLENAKIDNYNYVKYFKADNGLVAEMECVIPEEGTKIFYYYFDSNDYLQKICMEYKGVRETVFDRDLAIKEAKLEYYNSKVDYLEAI